MVLSRLTRSASSSSFSRFHSTLPKFSNVSRFSRRAFFFSFSVAGGAAYCLSAGPLSVVHVHADHVDSSSLSKSDRNVHNALSRASFSTLLRSYFVYSVCSFPAIVNYSPVIISAATSIPGLRQIAEAVIRGTFFAQFVGGDTAEGALPVLAQLRRNNIGALLGYSVEVDEDQANSIELTENRASTQGYIANVEETIRSIDVAADFEKQFPSQFSGKTWVAIKLTALLPSADTLIKLSNYLIKTRSSTQLVPLPGIPHASDLQFLTTGSIPSDFTPKDYEDLKEFYVNLIRIADRAYRRDVKLIIDAEYTWYQPAIDAFSLSLMYRYNKIQNLDIRPRQPLIYGTFQAYLKRTPEHLAWSLEDARKNGYALGIKLVRGAYHHFETEAAPSSEKCPVWNTKIETDRCFNSCAEILVTVLQENVLKKTSLGILFGTHNADSCNKILHKLVESGLAEHDVEGRFILKGGAAEHLAIAQLYGMSDALTDSLIDRVRSDTPFIIKYIPYGPLSSIMPYLARRAVENSSILSGDGGAVAERKRVGSELCRRLFKGPLSF